MKHEILAPAGEFNIGLKALYSGADALYLGTSSFGARAYAHNFSLDEVKEVVRIAHALGKKIYITINTIIKNSEILDCYKLIDTLYTLDVDGLIVTDIAVYNHLLDNYPKMECHISTQVGVKSSLDAKYFEKLGAKRVVLARELSLEEIENIKNENSIELEVFIHGALCVSYSGACLMSSMLSLRSGNRGRCSQNCRREYKLYDGEKKLTDDLFILSMKDLNGTKSIDELKKIGVNSFKIEGRMKDANYVSTLVRYYRNLVDKRDNDIDVENIFHREFTNGFLGYALKENITNLKMPSNVGKLIGKVLSINDDIVNIEIDSPLNKGDRIRISGKEKEYVTIEEMYQKGKKIESGVGLLSFKTPFKINEIGPIYKMIDANLSSYEVSSDLIPLDIKVTGKLNDKLILECNNIKIESSNALQTASKIALNYDMIYEQLRKLNDTPYYLRSLDLDIEDNLFLSLSNLNEMRRNLVSKLYEANDYKRPVVNNFKDIKVNKHINDFEIYATVSNIEQYETLKKLGIKAYFKNYSNYFDKLDKDISDKEVLASTYGALLKYKGKDITTDYTFNVINTRALKYLLRNEDIKHVTLSYETSFDELKDISNTFIKEEGYLPPIDYLAYGYLPLMKMKYCPIKAIVGCKNCKKTYNIRDNGGKFYILNQDCNITILNGLPYNVLDRVDEIKKYASRIRLDFTIETSDEVIEVINMLKNKKVSGKATKAYYKREIL